MASSSSSAPVAQMERADRASVPWIEKYRPKDLSSIAHQEEVVATLKRTLDSGNLPHLLFYGPPGTGKTSTILAVARELYGPELMKARVLELNASNERGIDVIRNKVKQFASLAVGKEQVAGHPCPPYKIIILDEADSMTADAQSALRRTMEQFTRVTRFCIICNYVSRIIEPLTSRCAKFRYKPLPETAMINRLKEITKRENVACNEDAYQMLLKVSQGDMRKSITLLQSAQRLMGPGEALDAENVEVVAGMVPDDVIRDVFEACKQNSFAEIERAARDIVASGYPADQIFAQLQPAVIASSELSDLHKSKIAIRLAEADKKLHDHADEFLQLLDVLAFISKSIVSL